MLLSVIRFFCQIAVGAVFLSTAFGSDSPKVHSVISQYTSYNSSKSHFSRARFQLESAVNQDLSETLDYSATFRLSGDPILWNSAQYPLNVQNDERLDLDIRSLYLGWTKLPFKMRIGRQEVIWGEALHYFSADLLHPKNYADFFTNDLSWARIPQTGIWMAYDNEEVNLQLVYFPFSEAHRLPKPGSEFFLSAYSVESLGVSGAGSERRFDFKSPTLGANLGWRLSSLDLHLMGVWDRDPRGHYVASRNEYERSRLFSTAFTASNAWDSLVMRFETTVAFSESLNTVSTSIETERSTEAIHLLSAEWSLTPEILLTQNLFWSQRYGCSETTVLKCRTVQHGTGVKWSELPYHFSLSSTAWVEYKDPSLWWSTQLERSFGDHTRAILQVDQFMGAGATIYSELSNRDQIALKMEVSF